MGRWWTLFNRELAQRCLPRPSTVEGSYYGLWVPLLLVGSVGLVLTCFGPADKAACITVSVYLIYLLANAARLGAKTSLSPVDDAPSLEVFSARLLAASLPLVCEVLLFAPLVLMVMHPAGRWAWVGYLELLVLSATLLGLNSAVRERSALQATARTWLLLCVFLLISAFAIWLCQQQTSFWMAGHALTGTPSDPLLADVGAVLARFNPLWGFPLVLNDCVQPATLTAIELLIYGLALAALTADTVGHLQRTSQPAAPGLKLHSTPFSPGFLCNCLLTSLLQEGRTGLSATPAVNLQPVRTLAFTAVAGVLAAGTVLFAAHVSADHRQRHLLHTCEANEKSLAIALECYATDNQGLYPRSMRDLYPRYIAALPTCPAAGECTYVETYTTSPHQDAYSFYCWGENHLAAGAPSNHPAFSSTQGLMDGKGLNQPWNSDFWHGVRHRLYLTNEPPWNTGLFGNH